MKIVRNPNRWLTKLSRAAALLSLMAGGQAATAQDGAFTFGRSPSGSASEVIDSNRDGFGMSFRGGHMAGDTVGRTESITHIGLSPYINIENGLFFGDTRLMRANEGGLAWTLGGGYRQYLPDLDVVIGGNGYFDRSELTGAHLNQWGAGAEILSHGWEARGNFYQTFGTTSALINQRVAPNSTAFQGENITFTRIDTFAEALRGFDAEAGFLLPGEFSERIDLRAFGGGYMYQGENIDQFGGWSARMQADIGRWLELGLKLTDDERFDTTLMFSAAVHFGGFESQEHTKRSAIQRFREPVRRNMHVVALQTDVSVGNQIAINPDTNLPFTIAHVNSNDLIGPFSGTVDNPFQSLNAGLGAGKDITFVHAGSVFNAAPENVVTLAANRRLIGEGFIQADRDVVTNITVNALGQNLTLPLPDSPTFAADPTLSRPTLLNSVGNAVTMANESQFAGFIIDSPTGNGIFSNAAENTLISDVLIRNAGNSAILLQNTAGTTSITDTTLVALPAATGATFHVNGGDGRIQFAATDAFQLSSITNTSPQASVLIENMTGGLVDMTNSSITDDGGRGVIIQNNAAGNAVIDNLSVSNSLGTGVSILNSGGVYSFRKTSAQLQQLTIDNAAQQGILIDNLSGTVNFTDSLLVSNRNAEGIEVRNSSGSATFAELVTVADLGAGVGTEAAVSVHDQLAGGRVVFGDNLAIRGTTRGSFGNGILLTNNNAASLFQVDENTSIVGTDLASIAIATNDGQVRFEGQTSISQRLLEGIAITDSAGAILFGQTNNDTTTVLNDLAAPSQNAAILATNNSANISFANAVVTNAQGNAGGGAGLSLIGNTGDINFGIANVESFNGVGVFGLNNQKIGIAGGAIVTDTAAAVNIEESGIDINLQSVTSTNSPDYGIRLVETNKDDLKTFQVDPNQQNTVAGDGGTIDGAKGDGLDNDDAAGVFLQNAGQVRLKGMILSDNEFGIRIRNTETTPGLAENTKQNFILDTSRVETSDIRGLDSQDLMGLAISDSIFDDNGDDAAVGQETILLDYTVRLDDIDIIRVDQSDDPFVVLIEDSEFISNTSDMIRVGQSDPAAVGSVIQFEMFRNTITVNDTVDTTVDVLAGDLFDDGVIFDWNGPAWARFENNQFDMTAAEQQQAISFRNRSTTDQSLISIRSNVFNVNNVTVNVGAVDVRADGPSIMNDTDFQISGNEFTLNDGAGVNVGGRPIGMRFTLAQNAGLSLLNNDIVIDADGGTGILIARASASSNFVINGNRIGFSDTGTGQERGIIFSQVTGVVNLFGSVDNQVVILQNALPGNAAVETPFFMPAFSNNGQIIVNGAFVP